MYLLDTNIIIYAVKNKPESVLTQINHNKDRGLFISSITLAELEFGVANSKFPEKNRFALMGLLSIFSIISFEDKDAQYFGNIKSYLKNQGTLIGSFDMLIAAQAVSRDLILVTNNIKEFERIPNIKIENWVNPTGEYGVH